MRRLLIAGALVAAAAPGARGGDDDERPQPKRPTRLTAAQVQERFERLTGDRLEVDRVPKSLAKRALSEGGVLLPGDEEQFVTVPDATVLGRLRLSR